MNNITLGKYINNNTLLHRLDPRNKFVMLFILMVAVFINIGFIGYGLLAILIITLFIIAKINFLLIFKSLKPMWFMMFILLIFNLFLVKEGTPISFWGITIYSQAFIKTLNVVCRIALLISISTLFTATTKPMDITIAIDDLFSFLKVFKINVHILSMTISIALRFIPTILDETYRIMKAQASRGVDFVNGRFKEKIVAISSLIIPLFISAFTRSDDLANALEARSYNPLGKRTRYRKLAWMAKDTISLLLTVIILGSFITLSVLGLNLDTLIMGILA